MNSTIDKLGPAGLAEAHLGEMLVSRVSRAGGLKGEPLVLTKWDCLLSARGSMEQVGAEPARQYLESKILCLCGA